MSDIFFVDGQALTPDVFWFNKDGDGYISGGSTQATDFRPGQLGSKIHQELSSLKSIVAVDSESMVSIFL